MKKNIIILENIRSAYNVGNVIRTADALGRDVWLTGYTPSPLEHPKVKKTSLGAEEHIDIKQFNYTQDAIQYAQDLGIQLICAEITSDAIDLSNFQKEKWSQIWIIFWNEVDGILPQTLQAVGKVVYIPMVGVKESLNIGQSTAIFMWQLK